MCGIVGVVAPFTEFRDAIVDEMNQSIFHRGPDEAGRYSDPSVSLAMRRLSIQDVAHGHQPTRSESGRVVCIMNGEIYNVRELQDMLRGRGHTLANESDTECLPHLYEEFGLDFVDHLRGMYAIALWDIELRRLVLVRDRMGKKPLYYSAKFGELRFASELKGLLAHPETARVANPLAISHYLTYQYVPSPFSAVEGVSKLPPAHRLVFEGGSAQVSRYWTLPYAPAGTKSGRTRAELAEELREQILDSVRVRMISERPVGAFLSGGLDSSAIVAAMHQVSSEQVRTFSIGFREETHNELPFAAKVAARYGTEHHEMIVEPDALSVIPRLVRSFDEPFADSSAIPSWYLADMARQNVVVALNGDGGDEALGGYTRYLRFLETSTRRFPKALTQTSLRAGRRLRKHSGKGTLIRKAASAAILLGESDPARRYARFLSYFRPEEKAVILSDNFAAQVSHHVSEEIVDELWNKHLYTDVANRIMAIDTHSYLPGDLLPKVDITTMSVSLEARSPLLDHKLIEWAAAIPGGEKIVRGEAKSLLKTALEGWIDDDLIHRRKQGFGIPLGKWLRGPLREMVYDTLTDVTATQRGYFDPGAVRTMIDGHMAGEDRSGHIYALLMLELWHREVLL